MRIDKIEVKPVQNSLNPEIMFEMECFIKRKLEIPLEITGGIFSDDNMKIANIHELIHGPDKSIELSAKDWKDYGEEKSIIKVIAQLNRKTLDYIETLRTKNEKGDVILTIDLFVKTVISETCLSTMLLINPNAEVRKQYPLLENYKDAMLVAYQNKKELSTSYSNMWILSGNGGPTFIKLQYENFKKTVTIPSSDWIHDYSPVFQIGKFSVFEYLLPDYIEGSESIEERLNESINAIKKMEEHITKGEWNDVIEDSRPVWELIRKESDIKDLLKRDGYTEDAINDLFGYTDSNGNKHEGCLNSLFNFASKFHHKLDKQQKKVQPDIKASKEDAYLIYATSMNVVNMISKKMQRLSK